MGREIRRVPPHWEHPKKEVPNHRLGRMETQYQPMRNEPFAAAMEEWYADWKAWCAGTHEDFAEYGSKYSNYWEWSGGPPDPEYYRPEWKDGEATWFQMYETVSEGTPVTPPFETKDELVNYLVESGTFWDKTGWGRKAAEQFVKNEWAPSMMVQAGKIYDASTGFPE